MDFRKVIDENVEKNIHFITNISLHKVTGILKFYEVLFCTYCKGLFVFKKQLLCLYSSVYE